MTIIRYAVALLIACSCLLAQSRQPISGYTAGYSSTATTEKITVQQPASGARTVRFASAYVYCAAGCDIDQSRDGTAATATAVTRARLNPSDAGGSKATAYRSSDVGSGTTISPPVTLAAGGSTTLDLEGIYLIGDGSGINYSLSVTGASSGKITVIIKWFEE